MRVYGDEELALVDDRREVIADLPSWKADIH